MARIRVNIQFSKSLYAGYFLTCIVKRRSIVDHQRNKAAPGKREILPYVEAGNVQERHTHNLCYRRKSPDTFQHHPRAGEQVEPVLAMSNADWLLHLFR